MNTIRNVMTVDEMVKYFFEDIVAQSSYFIVEISDFLCIDV